jgi:dsDNA-binding SOS-regulon protein
MTNKTCKFQVRLTEAEKKQWCLIAKRKQLTIAEVLRQVMGKQRLFIGDEKQQKLYLVLGQLGNDLKRIIGEIPIEFQQKSNFYNKLKNLETCIEELCKYLEK